MFEVIEYLGLLCNNFGQHSWTDTFGKYETSLAKARRGLPQSILMLRIVDRTATASYDSQ
jgi:hypothetical protein